MTFKQTLLDPHTVHECQMMIREIIKDRVCSLESEAALIADDMPAYSKQLNHAARELDAMQLQTFLLLHDVWDAACTSMVTEVKGVVEKPSLPNLTPVCPVEVVSD